MVPIKPDPLSVVGLPLLERYIEEYTTDTGVNLASVGIIFTMVRRPFPSVMRDVMDDIRKERGTSVFSDYLSQATKIAESVAEHQPLLQFKKTGNTTKLQIIDITSEFLKRTGG